MNLMQLPDAKRQVSEEKEEYNIKHNFLYKIILRRDSKEKNETNEKQENIKEKLKAIEIWKRR